MSDPRLTAAQVAFRKALEIEYKTSRDAMDVDAYIAYLLPYLLAVHETLTTVLRLDISRLTADLQDCRARGAAQGTDQIARLTAERDALQQRILGMEDRLDIVTAEDAMKKIAQGGTLHNADGSQRWCWCSTLQAVGSASAKCPPCLARDIERLTAENAALARLENLRQCGVIGEPDTVRKVCELPFGHEGYHRQGRVTLDRLLPCRPAREWGEPMIRCDYPNRACFSRSGWWQTLCGRDAANQGVGWSSSVANVGCKDCLKRIKNRDHYRWKNRHILMKMRKPANGERR